jgi:alanyl-tRNA synthetase
MTDRLYYNDPSLREFDATIRGVTERGDRVAVTLDRTAFYPTSGGQPFDTGTLGPFRVVDVLDENGGTIEHVLETMSGVGSDPRVGPGPTHGSALAPGERVHGIIDWGRRFDHMQQHTGQHVLSAALDKLFDVRTISFHLGAAASTIDLAREMTPAEIAAAEDEANRIVWEDRPVAIRFATAEEAAAMPLRKESVRGGTLRLIDVEGFDLSACGGTHVARTGAIGIIAVASWERFKGGQRIEFLCGARALGRFRSQRTAIAAGVRLLSVLPEELPASIERLQAEAKEQKRSLAALQTELARYRADELATTAETIPSGARLVRQAVDADANGLKSLAMSIAQKPGYIVVLTSTARPALIVVARSPDVDVAANRIVAGLIAAFGGRGGGKADIAQGGGLDGNSDSILDRAREDIIQPQL